MIKRNLSGAKPLMVLCGMLVCCISAVADSSDDVHCSDRTISGDYGWTAQGLVSTAPQAPPQGTFSAVGTAHFDGRGNIAWLEHTVVNGTVLGAYWTSATGTYTVNANCTGTAVVFTPNSPVPVNLAFVVVKRGKEIRTVADGNAINSVYIRIDD